MMAVAVTVARKRSRKRISMVVGYSRGCVEL